MDEHTKIGKSILDQYAKYAEKEVIDDEAEYFSHGHGDNRRYR